MWKGVRVTHGNPWLLVMCLNNSGKVSSEFFTHPTLSARASGPVYLIERLKSIKIAYNNKEAPWLRSEWENSFIPSSTAMVFVSI